MLGQRCLQSLHPTGGRELCLEPLSMVRRECLHLLQHSRLQVHNPCRTTRGSTQCGVCLCVLWRSAPVKLAAFRGIVRQPHMRESRRRATNQATPRGRPTTSGAPQRRPLPAPAPPWSGAPSPTALSAAVGPRLAGQGRSRTPSPQRRPAPSFGFARPATRGKQKKRPMGEPTHTCFVEQPC